MDRKNLISISVVLVVGVVVLSLIVFLVGIVILFAIDQSTSSENIIHDYQMTEIRAFPELSTRNSIITLPQSLEREEYITFLNEESGGTAIITNLGGSEYECTGSCYCSKFTENSRRIAATGNILTRGAMILITAFSTTMAIQIAKEAFDDQCVQQFSDICEEPYIVSETHDCSQSSSSIGGKGCSSCSSDSGTGDPPSIDPLYECKGHCVRFIDSKEVFMEVFMRDPEYIRLGSTMVGDCSKLVLERKLALPPETREMGLQALMIKEEDVDDLYLVRILFSQLYLAQFCMHNSGIRSEYFSDDFNFRIQKAMKAMETESQYPELERAMMGSLFTNRPWCFGYLQTGGNEPNSMDVENVQCVKV